MSYNHPYRKPQDDFRGNHDIYTDSQRMYHRESSAYRSRIRTTSPEQPHSGLSPSSSEPSVLPPGKALSFLQSCGLDAEDLQTLAELPEHLMTAETLPELLAEIKKKKATNTSSSRSSMFQPSSSGRSWEDRSHAQPAEYPLDLPVRQLYPHHRDQVQSWEDRWESDRPTRTYSSSGSNYVVEYNHLKDEDNYFDKASYATESASQKSSVVSQSYSTYSRDITQPSYLSSRDVGQPSHLSSRDVSLPSLLSSRDVGQPSQLSSRDVGLPSLLSGISLDVGQPSQQFSRDVGLPSLLSGIDVGQASHLSNRDVRLPSLLSCRNVGQPAHLSSRDVGQPSRLSSGDISQPSYLSSRDVSNSSHQSSRNISQPSHQSSRNISQPSHQSSRNTSQPSHQSSRNISQPSHQSSRNSSQPSHQSSRNISQPSHQSSRNNSQPSHLSSRDVSQSSHHRRTEKVHRVPTRKEASDFHGKLPPVFPYACILCEITVLSNKDWNVHIKGAQHANSQLSLVERYPEWDQRIQSARRNESLSEKPQPRATQERGETSGSRNGSSSSRSGLSSSKSESSNSKNSHNVNKTEQKDKCKVVCVKFEVDEVDEAYLKKLLGQFGAIVKMVMFPRMAFAEMGSPDQAADIVKYFIHNPLRVKGQLLEFSLSAACSFLQNSRVVSFSPLPSGEGISSELTAIARRFGSVKHSLFLPSRGYVEMANAQEASKLVEHYSTNSLKLKGKTIHVGFSAEYQTLGEKDADKEELRISSSKRRRSLSPRRRSHSSRKDSPSPKRRTSAENSRSCRSSNSKKQDECQRSKERSKESSRRDRSSRTRSRKSPSKDQNKPTDDSTEQKTEDKKDQSDTMCDDSDLEGVTVIADDCDELNSEDEEFIEIDQEDDQEDDQNSSAAPTEQELFEDMQNLEESDDNTTPSNTDLANIHSDNSESVPNATTDGSSECKDIHALQQSEEVLNDKTVETLDRSCECKEAKELPENQEAPKDKTAEISDASSECKEAQELQQNQEMQTDKTVKISDGSNECKEAQEFQQDQEAPKDKTVDISNALSDCNEAQELHQNQEAPVSKTVEITDGSSECKEAQDLQQNQEMQKDKTVEFTDGSSECKEAQELQQNREMQKDKTVKISDGSSECKEAQELQQDQKMQQDKTVKASDGSGDYKEAQELQQNQEVQKDKIVAMEQEASDFPVNLENCITLDEFTEEMTDQADKQEISTSTTEHGKVLEVKGFPLAKKYTEADLLNIGKKCGEVAGCCLVRNNRKIEKALIEMVNAADASKLEAESKRQNFKLGGKILRITVSNKYTHVKERISVESDSGKAAGQKHVEVKTEEVSHSVTSWEETAGMPTGIESTKEGDEGQRETSTDTILQASSNEGVTSGENEKDESITQNLSDQLSSPTSPIVKESSNDNEGVNSKEDIKQVSATDDETGMLIENSDSVSETPTHLNDPVGTEFVRPVVGYFCSLCNAIYASEEEAKDEHCRTVLHHEKLKERMEQNRSA